MVLKVIALMLFGSMFLWAENIAVVVGAKSPIEHLEREQIRAVFLKKQRFFNGMTLKPINLAPSSPLRKAFESKVLQMDTARLERYWIREHYRGHRPPYRVDSTRAMVEFVTKVPGAIGYLPQEKVTKKMKVLYWITL